VISKYPSKVITSNSGSAEGLCGESVFRNVGYSTFEINITVNCRN